MREIEFRGWSDVSEAWVYGYLVVEKDGTHVIHFSDGSGFSSVRPESVGQYTGRKDCNDQKIYEGDILEGDEHFYYVVCWDDEDFMWMAAVGDPLCELTSEIEIIGNEFESVYVIGEG